MTDKIIKCHICDEETDFCCQSCEEPVCEDYCVVPTYMNQIDYALCNECNDSRETEYAIERSAQWEFDEKIRIKKKKAAARRKEIYWKPENVEKRRLKKEARLLARREAYKKRMVETYKIIGSMFRGMF